MQNLVIECFGVVIEVRAEHRVLDVLQPHFPYAWKTSNQTPQHFIDVGERHLQIGDEVFKAQNLAETQTLFASRAPLLVAEHSTQFVFLHAAVARWRGATILFPGDSFAGKTTLTKTLLQSGATYFSDEYALLDKRGNVFPYARPLRVRDENGVSHDVSPQVFANHKASNNCAKNSQSKIEYSILKDSTVSHIAFLRFQSGASWNVEKLSRGECALRLLEFAVGARTQPSRALQAVKTVSQKANAIAGTRGQSADAVLHLESWLNKK